MRRTCYVCDYIDHPDLIEDRPRTFYFDGKGWICSDCVTSIRESLVEFGDVEEMDDESMGEDTSTLPEVPEF